MGWIVILLPMIMEWIKACQEKAGREKTRRRLLKPDVFVVATIFWGLRKTGLRGKELLEAHRDVMGHLKGLLPDEVDILLADAAAFEA